VRATFKNQHVKCSSESWTLADRDRVGNGDGTVHLSGYESLNGLTTLRVAGSDTISPGLRATIRAIISDPPVYRKLRQEIDAAIANQLVSAPIRDSKARRLPYLQACIYEGLRCHPALVTPRERVTPSEGDIICGHKLPGGTLVGFNIWTSQHNTTYGKYPEVFRPERWLETSGEQAETMRKVWELVFGHGTSKCLGENLALMTMNKALLEVLVAVSLVLATH
jgi:cytochrome P450